jgi:DNA-binding beta-propeller fold protein YncE
MNSIVGPPVNLAITPDERLAIVANSLDWVQDGAAWKAVPDDKLYVIDLKASPPKLITTVQVGKQPSGLSISHDGKHLYVGNFLDSDVSILKVEGAKVTDTGKRLRLPGRPASMRGPTR